MKCKKCGAEIESKVLYCPECGESIQLVPDYNVLEEELLSRVVEDKNKSKDFANGVYLNKNNKEPQAAPSKPATKNNNPYFSKRFKICLGALIILAVASLFIIASYVSRHSYNNVMDMAVTAEKGGQYAKAIGYYEEAYNLKTDSFEAVYGAGRMYFKVKEYKKAVEFLELAREYETDTNNIYSYLAQSYDALNDKESIKSLAADAPTDEIYQMLSEYLVTPPTFSNEGGDYDTDLTIFLTADKDVQIFYTTNGKNPVTSGKLYSKGIKLKEGTTEIKAVSLNSEGEYSEVVSNTYNITYAVLETPIVTPEAGTYTDLVYISIIVPTGATAYYSWDGSNPAEGGIKYEEPFPIINGSSILSVIIIDENGNQSPLFRGQYNH